MVKKIEGQMNIFDFLESEPAIGDKTEVEIKGAVNLKSRPISNYEVRMAYGDLVLIIAMLHDYLRQIDEMLEKDEEPPNYPWALWKYYRNKFLQIADSIGEQIEYDYEVRKKQCEKKAVQEDKSTVGGDALELAAHSKNNQK